MRSAFLGACAATALLAAAPNAGAALLLLDTFDSEALKLNQTTFANWNVTSGSVDLIGVPRFFNFYPGNGRYVDLDGSTHHTGQLSSKQSFAAGTYTLEFDLGGNDRGHAPKTTEITLGSFSEQITLSSGAGLNPFSVTFTTTGGNLVFTELGAGPSDNVGNVLDDVSLVSDVPVSGIPELTTWAMMIIGFGGVALQIRRQDRTISGSS
jgi:hypothetical protein